MRRLNHRNEFPQLLDELDCQTAVEIGTAAGFFARTLLQSTKLQQLTLVDCWNNPADIAAGFRDRAYELAASSGGRVTILEKTSIEAAREIAFADFVYIDAQHAYEHAAEDIRLWAPKARKLFAGHDYLPWNTAANAPCGVMLAVEELVAGMGLPVWVTGANSPTWTERLRVGLEATENPDMGQWGENLPSWYAVMR